MTEKTKKTLVVTVCCLLCVAAVVGIITRYERNAEVPSGIVSDTQPENGDPTVNINKEQTSASPNDEVTVDVQKETATPNDPAQGADSEGPEQTIQADPVKPDPPEKPDQPTGEPALPEVHENHDVPQEERKTVDEVPPTYETPPTPPATPTNTEPPAGSTNDAGQVYVPGFGWVENSGENHGGVLDDMYENGNKIGIMGG